MNEPDIWTAVADQGPPRGVRCIWTWNGVSVGWVESTNAITKSYLKEMEVSYWMVKRPPQPPEPPKASP